MKFIVGTIFFTLLSFFAQAQECWDIHPGSIEDTYGAFQYYNSPHRQPYNSPRYYHFNNGSRSHFSGNLTSMRRYDNSQFFSSGISSYQGTSTGPGPNGGYPGSPRGTYQTNYYDTSIYPNTYMRVYPGN